MNQAKIIGRFLCSSDGARMNRKFPQDGSYQQVYDWIGTVQPETDFTLYRAGDGFIREACQHDQKLTAVCKE